MGILGSLAHRESANFREAIIFQNTLHDCNTDSAFSFRRHFKKKERKKVHVRDTLQFAGYQCGSQQSQDHWILGFPLYTSCLGVNNECMPPILTDKTKQNENHLRSS